MFPSRVVLVRCVRCLSLFSSAIAVLACLFFTPSAAAQVSTPPGIQIGSTNEFGIDLATSDIHLEIPLRSKAGGPLRLSISLIANYGVSLNQNTRPAQTYVNNALTALTATPAGLLGATVQANRRFHFVDRTSCNRCNWRNR